MTKKILLYTAGFIPLAILVVLIIQEGTQEKACQDLKDQISLASDVSTADQLLQQYRNKNCLKQK